MSHVGAQGTRELEHAQGLARSNGTHPVARRAAKTHVQTASYAHARAAPFSLAARYFRMLRNRPVAAPLPNP